tara:strand:- start:4 stop:270 length:267 start_codon:yes stop_codon:yes gene_type:complete
MQAYKILGATNVSPTSTGTASTVEGAHYAMLSNSGTTVREVTILTAAGGTPIGTVALLGSERMVIKKDDTDAIYSAHAEVFLTPVYPN